MEGRTPARADAGGSAGAGGFDYQHRVAAWFAVVALAGEAVTGVLRLVEGLGAPDRM